MNITEKEALVIANMIYGFKFFLKGAFDSDKKKLLDRINRNFPKAKKHEEKIAKVIKSNTKKISKFKDLLKETILKSGEILDYGRICLDAKALQPWIDKHIGAEHLVDGSPPQGTE